MKVLLLLLLVSADSGLAQHRSIHLKLRDVQTDTVKKQLIFHYRLGNIAPKDSLGIAIKRASGQLIRLKEVYGDVGITLTDGRKTIFWNPVVERQKFDEAIEVIFFVTRGESQGITRKQTLDAGRWAISAGLLGYCVWDALDIIRRGREYNGERPITPNDKFALDAKMNDILHRERQFYVAGAITMTSLLANLALSLMQAKTKLKPARFTVTNSAFGVGVAYKF